MANETDDIVIRLDHISKKYRGVEAVKDVCYVVKAGSVFALLGENGAGKTTTIRILLGMARPDSGTADVLGMSPLKDDVAIRKRVGYVPEQPTLYEWMTVAEIGRFASAFYPEGYWPEYERQIAGFELPMSAKIKTLSKGMKAEVSLSLALASNPELLIFDEPTSGLDAMVRRKFLESMVDRAAAGKTVFLSSHQISEVERIADTVAIMRRSRVLLVEPLETLKATTSILRLVFKDKPDTDPDFGRDCFETFVDRRVEGREMKLVGRRMTPDALARLRALDTVAEVEERRADLEEIFVAYMEGFVTE